LAAQALANMGILTYAVGIAGFNPQFMDNVAMAGGTNKAFNVGLGNAAQDLLNALHAIQSQGVGCTFQMPMGMNVDPNLVNVTYTPMGMGMPTTLGQVPDAGACTAKGGWYYDNPQNPTEIILCPSTCMQISADTLAKIDIILGCKTHIN